MLAGGIAHDFNNILVGVLGHAELAELELPRTSKAREHLASLTKAAQRAADLTKQMLAYAGKGRFVVEPLSLNRLVVEMNRLLQASIAKNVVLKMDLADDLPLIDGAATQMRQILMNLILNGAEAIGELSGLVSVRTGVMEVTGDYLSGTYVEADLPEGYYVYLEVSDTGDGMDPETVQKVFDPFFTTKFTGRGLGLAAVLGIVQGHKGAIKVYSQPRSGTTFKVLLPCSAESLELPERTHSLERLPDGLTALVVDDEDHVLTVSKRLLEKFGVNVVTARDGMQAVEIYRQRSSEIDFVLLDLTMPHMNGDRAFQEFRRINRDVRVILSSGYNEQDISNRFAGKGLAAFIQKPYMPGELINVVRTVLEDPPSPSPSSGRETD